MYFLIVGLSFYPVLLVSLLFMIDLWVCLSVVDWTVSLDLQVRCPDALICLSKTGLFPYLFVVDLQVRHPDDLVLSVVD